MSEFAKLRETLNEFPTVLEHFNRHEAALILRALAIAEGGGEEVERALTIAERHLAFVLQKNAAAAAASLCAAALSKLKQNGGRRDDDGR